LKACHLPTQISKEAISLRLVFGGDGGGDCADAGMGSIEQQKMAAAKGVFQ
jgi:hypothetical protein